MVHNRLVLHLESCPSDHYLGRYEWLKPNGGPMAVQGGKGLTVLQSDDRHSTYMSLRLARLCGKWWLVSRNYKAWGASGGKYEAQIVIFCILATVNRFSWISRKAESRRGKLESRWRNRKAIEESGKLLKKAESFWRKLNFVWGKLDFRRRKIPIFPRDSLVSGNFGVSFLTPDLLPRAHMDLLWWTQILIT